MPEKESQNNDTSDSGRPEFGLNGKKIIYGKDGKPCRTCNSLSDFKFAMGSGKSNPKPSSKGSKDEKDPPDVEELGRSSWTLLHSIAATYPERPNTKEQADMKQFISLFGNFYPCWYCGDDFKGYMEKNEPKVNDQDSLGKWLCDAHNNVNTKLGKPKFDCNLWKKRWRDGWDEKK